MAKYRITAPDGSAFDITAPDDATPQQVQQFAQQQFASMPKASSGVLASVGGAVRDALAGAVRGAGSIGATVLWPIDKATDLIQGDRGPTLSNLVTGKQSLSRNEERRAAMDSALHDLVGADTNSTAYALGKTGAEIAGTMGAGGAVANGLARIPAVAGAAAPALDAIRTAGMSAGGVGGAAGQALRAAGGAVNGAASAAMVNPGDALTGAGVGAVMPAVAQGVSKVAGSAAGAVRRAVQSQAARTGGEIGQALELNTPQQVQDAIVALNAAQEIVPGSRPTVAQVLQTPQAGTLERVVGDTRGGAALKEAYVAQNAARLGVLEGVAPTAPAGAAMARADTGAAIGNYAQGARGAAKAATRAAYQEVPQDEAALYLPDLAAIRDKYFGRGVFTGRDAADSAVRTAQEIGTYTPPVGRIVTADTAPTLAQAVRRAGGLSISNNSGLSGEVAGLRGDLKNLVMRNGGKSLADMAEAMHEAGYIADDGTETLLKALRQEAMQGPVYSTGADLSNSWQAARNASMGAEQGAAMPTKVTLGEFDNLRKSIGQLERAAQRDPARATEAAALGEMRKAMDERVNQVVAGDGAIDENLPIAWADALDRARGMKVKEVDRFMTGPQSQLFRKGADGQPLRQGGEVASLFWGNRPGLAEDVQSFRKLIDDNPALLGQFRSMVTTEGAGTADAAGRLGTKFAKWVDAMRPGIEKAFSPDQVDMLSRIAQDIRRGESAAAAGMSRGSNTYQNANNALKLGLLDSAPLQWIANKIPVGGAALTAIREAARNDKAARLSAALSDPAVAAQALLTGGVQAPGLASRALSSPAVQGLFYRAPAPLLAGRQGP